MLVEAGQACVWDFSNNEFNPADWWGGQIPAGVCIKGESDSIGHSARSLSFERWAIRWLLEVQ